MSELVRPSATGVMHLPRGEVVKRIHMEISKVLDKAVVLDKASRREMAVALALVVSMLEKNDASKVGR